MGARGQRLGWNGPGERFCCSSPAILITAGGLRVDQAQTRNPLPRLCILRLAVLHCAYVLRRAQDGRRRGLKGPAAPSEQGCERVDVDAVVEGGRDAGQFLLDDAPLPEVATGGLLLPSAEASLVLPGSLCLVDPAVRVAAFAVPVEVLAYAISTPPSRSGLALSYEDTALGSDLASTKQLRGSFHTRNGWRGKGCRESHPRSPTPPLHPHPECQHHAGHPTLRIRPGCRILPDSTV